MEDLCFPCSYSRHFLGTLTQHKFQFLPFSTPRYASLLAEAQGQSMPLAAGGTGASQRNRLRPADLCQWCETEPNVIRCPTCDIRFCTQCADSFHSLQLPASKAACRGSWLSHKLRYEYCADVPLNDDGLAGGDDVPHQAGRSSASSTVSSPTQLGAAGPQGLSAHPATSPQHHLAARSPHQRVYNQAMMHARMGQGAVFDEQRAAASASVPLTPQQSPSVTVPGTPAPHSPIPGTGAASNSGLPQLHLGVSISGAGGSGYAPTHQPPIDAHDSLAPPAAAAAAGHARSSSGLPNRTLDFEGATSVSAESSRLGQSVGPGEDDGTDPFDDGNEVTMPRFSDASESPLLRPGQGANVAALAGGETASRLPLQVSLDDHADSVGGGGASGGTNNAEGSDGSSAGAGAHPSAGGSNALPLASSRFKPFLSSSGTSTPTAGGGWEQTTPHHSHGQSQHTHPSLHINPRTPSTRSRSVLLSSPPLSQFALASPRKVAHNVSTFKLANYVLGYASTPCPSRDSANFQVALDAGNHIMSVTSIDKEQGGVQYARHLASIHSVVADPSDPRRLTVLFRDSAPRAQTLAQVHAQAQHGGGSGGGAGGGIVVKLYAMTVSEARMIQELLGVMVAAEYDNKNGAGAGASADAGAGADALTTQSAATSPTGVGAGPGTGASALGSSSSPTSPVSLAPAPPASWAERPIADTDIIYIGRVLKRGKMSWAPRWLVLKKFHLRVYKTNKLHVPSNNISLSGAKITTDEKDKHLTLICMDRSYTFKLQDVVERDSVMSLFHKAMELKRAGDGSLGMSSIGGSMPAPPAHTQTQPLGHAHGHTQAPPPATSFTASSTTGLVHSTRGGAASGTSSTATGGDRPERASFSGASTSAGANLLLYQGEDRGIGGFGGDAHWSAVSGRSSHADSDGGGHRRSESSLKRRSTAPGNQRLAMLEALAAAKAGGGGRGPHASAMLSGSPLPQAATGSPLPPHPHPSQHELARGSSAAASANNGGGESALPELEAEHLKEVRRGGGGGAAGRRKSRRTISRDFHNVLGKTAPHAMTVDESMGGGSGGGLGGGGGGASSKIEFVEFAIDSRAVFVRPSRTLCVGVYAFMRLLGESMSTGAHLSPTLYVPRSVWYQNGAKFQAFNAKLEVLEMLRMQMLTIMPPPSSSNNNVAATAAAMLRTGAGSGSASATTPAAAGSSTKGGGGVPFSDDLERSLSTFRLLAEESQDKLAQHLAFIHTVKDSYRQRIKSKAKEGAAAAAAAAGGAAAGGGAGAGGAAVAGLSGSGAIGGGGGAGAMGHSQLGVPGGASSGGDFISSAYFSSSTAAGAGGAASSSSGGNVAESGTTPMSLSEKLSKSMKTFGKIVSRAASASKDKVDHEDSTRYVKLLHTVFDQSLVFRDWLQFLESEAAPAQGDNSWPGNKAIIDEHLLKISEFFYAVICNMVIRDLKSVLKRYIKHCMRTLVSH